MEKAIDSSNTLQPEVKMEDEIVPDTNVDTNVDTNGINTDTDQALKKNSDMSEITKVMQQTNKMLQMMMVINIGEDNYQKFSKIIDSGSSPEESEDLIEEDSTSLSLSTVEECYKLQAYSEYRYSVFTQIRNEYVNNCVSNVLDTMVTKCAVFFLNDTKSEIEGQRMKYYLAVKLFDCYFFQPADESCANLSTIELLQCISKHPAAVQLTFHEYLDEIKPLCCHFKSYNESMRKILFCAAIILFLAAIILFLAANTFFRSTILFSAAKYSFSAAILKIIEMVFFLIFIASWRKIIP